MSTEVDGSIHLKNKGDGKQIKILIQASQCQDNSCHLAVQHSLSEFPPTTFIHTCYRCKISAAFPPTSSEKPTWHSLLSIYSLHAAISDDEVRLMFPKKKKISLNTNTKKSCVRSSLRILWCDRCQNFCYYLKLIKLHCSKLALKGPTSQLLFWLTLQTNY